MGSALGIPLWSGCISPCIPPLVIIQKRYRAVQYSTVQCSTVQCSAVQYSAVQYGAVPCSAVKCSVLQWICLPCKRGLDHGMQSEVCIVPSVCRADEYVGYVTVSVQSFLCLPSTGPQKVEREPGTSKVEICRIEYWLQTCFLRFHLYGAWLDPITYKHVHYMV